MKKHREGHRMTETEVRVIKLQTKTHQRSPGATKSEGGDKEGCSVALTPQFMVVRYRNPEKLTHHPIHFHNQEKQTPCLEAARHEATAQVTRLPSLSSSPLYSFPPLDSGSCSWYFPFSMSATRPGSFKTSLRAPVPHQAHTN